MKAVVLLRSLLSVPPTFLATSRYRASSMCLVQIDSLLAHLSSLRSSYFVTIDRGAKNRISRASAQHQNAKSTNHRDQQLAYCAHREQQCDERPIYVSPHRGPELLLYFSFSVVTLKKGHESFGAVLHLFGCDTKDAM